MGDRLRWIGHSTVLVELDGVRLLTDPLLRERVVLLRRSEPLEFFRRLLPCLIGIEACASAHYSAREFKALGHTVSLMPARRLRPPWS